ncbi:MAG: transporter [Hyphomonadaceae bacterium]|nr:transporter [Hyphomonadaceae bacterium]
MRALLLGALAGSALCTTPAHAQDGLRGRDGAVALAAAQHAPTLSAPSSTPASAYDGALQVDETAAAERALERTLVRAGALLLPPGAVEMESLLRFTRIERTAPANIGAPGAPIIVEARQERDAADAIVGLRLGLPFDAQAELAVPLSAARVRTVTAFSGAPLAEDDDDGAGLGDVVLSLTKTVLHEEGARPDLFVAFIYDSATGDDEGAFAFGSGFHELGLALTAVKRVDPLVLIASGSYQRALERDGVQPSDQYGLDLRAVLAVSPTMSLRFGLEQTYATRPEFGGVPSAGADQLISTFVFGAAGALSRRTLVDFELGLGLTDDAPDYYLQTALPFRFSY